MTERTHRHQCPCVRMSPETIQTAQTPIGCVSFPATGRTIALAHHCVLSVACVTLGQMRPLRVRSQSDPASGHLTNQSRECLLHFINDQTHRSCVRSHREQRPVSLTVKITFFTLPTSPPLLKCANHQVYHLVHVC
jgi:hypothetical protein